MLAIASLKLPEILTLAPTRNENMDVLIISVTSDTIWVKQWWSRHSWGSLVGTSEYNIIHTGQLHKPLKQLSSRVTFPNTSDIELDFFSSFPSLVLPPPFVTWEFLSPNRVKPTWIRIQRSRFDTSCIISHKSMHSARVKQSPRHFIPHMDVSKAVLLQNR